ncbi:polyunsaturated fatty acid 5-lipoxygenase-like [Danio aesculapii]|uniref:polyunsaturated fatty acid 5-lipoxygenase-like n=1 Tax=Danio aesculapii TaxID=1142201 RepID=UPI0024C022C6|nr:polyunsaturated fatty acid 5-lipoxygenase-like [Danio aesculapii]
MFTYMVSLTTGSQKNAGTIDYIYLKLVGKEGESELTLVNKHWFEHLHSETVVSIEINVEETLGEILLVKLEKDRKFLFDDQWYCRYISVTAPTGDCFEFPCYRWISNDPVVLREGRGRLPQDEKLSILKEYRHLELENRQKQFRYGCWKSDFPMCMVSKLPVDVQFDCKKSVDFYSSFLEVMENLGLNKLENLFQSWKNFEDFEKIFITITIKNTVPEHLMNEWTEDEIFGYQFLNGCNPVMIKKCTKLPDKFVVTQEMVENSLDRGATLQGELQAGNIYIADYEILEDVQPNDTDSSTQQYLAAPFCLFYKNRVNKVMPIAIQVPKILGQKNTVFLPTDNQYDWLLAKMWVKSCDYNVHQLVTHLLRTHLISEVFAIAMFRQLSAVHPVYKLLLPHVRFTIEINQSARHTLIGDSGIFEKVNSTGGRGIGQVIKKAMQTLTYKSLCFPEAMKTRGVDNEKDLPNYYYRDDGMMVWEAVKSFVSDVVKIYYSSDVAVQKDEEIQAFVQDVCSSGMKSCPNNEFPNILKTRVQLIEYLTIVIFTASAQHAAVNFGQFDWYAWVPNTPSTMRKPPPTEKSKVDLKYIMESLPDRGRSSLHLGMVWMLSRFQDKELFLGEYPDKYFTEEPAMEAIKKFRKKIVGVQETISKRNETLKPPYLYLSPDRIPNSVAI